MYTIRVLIIVVKLLVLHLLFKNTCGISVVILRFISIGLIIIPTYIYLHIKLKLKKLILDIENDSNNEALKEKQESLNKKRFDFAIFDSNNQIVGHIKNWAGSGQTPNSQQYE